MSLLDIVNDFFGGGGQDPATTPPMAGGPADIRPAGYNTDGNSSELMQEMIKYMHDAIPKPEDDTRNKISRMLWEAGDAIGKADPEGGPLGQIGAAFSGGAKGYMESDPEREAARSKGAGDLFSKLLNQDKVEAAQAVADERLRQGDDRIRQADDRARDLENYRTILAGQGDRRLNQGDTRLGQGQQRINNLENYHDAQRADTMSRWDDKTALDWTRFYEGKRRAGVTEAAALDEFQRKLAKDKETETFHNETIQTRQDGQRMANEIKRRVGSKADPMKLWLDAQKMVESRRTHDFKNLDPQWDKEEWDRRMRKFEEFQTGVFNVIPNPQVNQEGGTTQPAPPPGQPAPSVQARPRVAASMIDRGKAIAGAKAAKAAGVPDAEILKRLQILKIDPKEAGF